MNRRAAYAAPSIPTLDVTPADERHFYARTQGPSASGSALVPGCRLQPGTRVRLRIHLREGLVRADGTVKWSRPREAPSGAAVRRFGDRESLADAPDECGIAWETHDFRSVDAVRAWLDERRP